MFHQGSAWIELHARFDAEFLKSSDRYCRLAASATVGRGARVVTPAACI
jgi:hypothetical protein